MGQVCGGKFLVGKGGQNRGSREAFLSIIPIFYFFAYLASMR